MRNQDLQFEIYATDSVRGKLMQAITNKDLSEVQSIFATQQISDDDKKRVLIYALTLSADVKIVFFFNIMTIKHL